MYESDKVSRKTVRRWRRNFKFRQNEENSERTVTVTDIINVSKVRKITKSDERYMIRNIVKAVGISLQQRH